MPIATAYIGESFPPEKRGSALGMVGAIYGIASTIGPTAGSALLDAAGKDMPAKLMAVLPKIQIPAGKGIVKTVNISSFSGNLSSDTLTQLQNADVTNIFTTVKNFSASMLDKALPAIKVQLQTGKPYGLDTNMLAANIKTSYLASVDTVRGTIETTFQATLNKGFGNLFLASAIIAGTGLVFTLLLKNKEKTTA